MYHMTPRAPSSSAANTSPTVYTGTIRLHPRGFGFITPDGGGEDIFAPSNRLVGILDADRVNVEVSDGSISSIVPVERSRREVFATILDGGVAEIDPGVGVERVACASGRVGDTVRLVELDGGWVVDEDLGDTWSETTLYRRIMARHRLPVDHDSDTVSEAIEIAQRAVRGDVSPYRRDLRELTTFTIDADHSRDLDDALSARIDADGAIRVWVHIADVAEHVVPGSACDLAARETPTSVYLPMATRPMLPAELSESALSLLPGVERDTMTVEMRIGAHGEVVSCDVYESRIVSKRRYSYETIADVIDRGIGRGDIADEQFDAIHACWAAATRLGVVRAGRGGVDGTRLSNQSSDASVNAHMLIERLMVAANEAVAHWLTSRNMPAVYRCHDAPGLEDVGMIEQTARAFGYAVQLPHPLTPRSFSAFVEQISGSEVADVMWDAIGSVLDRARYDTVNTGHFGLGSASYLHFTSPLRRYADLTVHRIVKAYLRGERDYTYTSELEELAVHITDVSRRAAQAERDARVILALHGVEENEDATWSGVVKSASNSTIRVYLTELGGVGRLPTRHMGRGWRFDAVRREAHRGSAVIRVGDTLSVRVVSVDPLSGDVELRRDTKRGPTTVRAEGREVAKRSGKTRRGRRGGQRRSPSSSP